MTTGKARSIRTLKLFLLLALSSALISGQQKIIKDDLGNVFILTEPPQRIVSLAPNITEILFSLGLGENIVGVTRYCDYPPEAREKEKVGGMLDPNLEKIKALNPDLIIGFRGNPLTALKRLQNLRARVFILDQGNDLESVFSTILKIGQIAQKDSEAEKIIQSLKRKYDNVIKALQSVIHRPRVFLVLHGGGLWTCGKASYLHDLLAKAKSINIAGKIPKKWLNYNQERLIQDNPEVIIILAKSEEDFMSARDWYKERPGFGKIEAIKSNRIYFLDENLASRFGPRLIQAFAAAAHLLHPGQI